MIKRKRKIPSNKPPKSTKNPKTNKYTHTSKNKNTPKNKHKITKTRISKKNTLKK